MIVSWLLFPLVLAALCLGCGLLVRRLAGAPVPGPLLMPLGFAVMVVVGEFAALSDATAELSAPVVAGAAVAGFLLAGRSVTRGIDRWAAVAGLCAFVIYAAPVAFSGEPTIAGYIKLDDTATWLALTDRVMEHGRDLSGLAPSTYEATLDFNLASGYPIGAFLPFGTAAVFVGRDLAWLFQPYLAFLASLLALSLYSITDGIVRSRALRAICAVVAAQAALLFGYYLWGGIKEVGGAALLVLVCGLLPLALNAWGDWRRAVPLSIAVAAMVGMLTAAGGAVWLAPALGIGFLLLLRGEGANRALRSAGAFAVVLVVLCLPWLLGSPLLPPTSAPLDAANAKGNLAGPLSPFQVFGIWPVGDFRVHPDDPLVTALLIAVVAGSTLAGALRVWRLKTARAPIVFWATALVGSAILVIAGSPWVGGKALATASPALLFGGIAGAAILTERGFRVEGLLAIAAIVTGVLWSNALAYRDVWLAPQDKLAELEHVGELIDGQGPALMTEYEPYGVRHFLRNADAEGASELRRRPVYLVNGEILGKAEFRDIDAFALPSLLAYRTLVLRRSPLASRPPLPFRLRWRGDFYEVWERPPGAPPPIKHLPLSDGELPSAVPDCRQIQRLAGQPGVGRIASSQLSGQPLVVQLASLRVPDSWRGGGELIYPRGSGTAEGSFESPRGDLSFWLGGSWRGRVEISVDGRQVGAKDGQLDRANQFIEVGSSSLDQGRHQLRLTYDGGGLAPGTGGPAFGLGPLVISRSTAADAKVRYVAPSRAGSLCGQALDWVEALRG